jgi:hypothetical protein
MTALYVGFNDTHLTEKLREQHGLTIARESVRRLRQQLSVPPSMPGGRRAPAGGGYRRRARGAGADRRQSVRVARDPRPGPHAAGAIDDATGEILALQFRRAEDVHGYASLFQHLFTTHGLPLALYCVQLSRCRPCS